MSGTTASLSSKSSSGVALPAPVLRLISDPLGTVFDVADTTPGSNALYAMKSKNLANVSVHGLPQLILDNLETYQPQLELMRYVSTRSRNTPNFSRNLKNSGYIHPSNGPAPSGVASRTHGGGTSPFAINALRQTEWPVTGWGQVIDVTAGMYAFMQNAIVPHRDNTGTVVATVRGLMPSGSKKNGGMGKRFPYWGRYKPGYFCFRWSIIDPSDVRGQRITGPLSNIVSLTNEIFPFIPDVSFDNKATASLDSRHNSDMGQFWLGSTSRLPR